MLLQEAKMFDFKKTVMMINWFARQCFGKSEDKLDLLKMIYMADRFHLRKYGRLISGDTYYAMNLGPVPSMTKTICDSPNKLSSEQKEFAYSFLQILGDKIHSLKWSEEQYFCPSEIEALNEARKKATFVKQSGVNLPDFTHQFPEWQLYRKFLTKTSSRRKMNILKFFSELNDSKKDLEYCLISSRLLQSNKQKFMERQAIEKMIANIHE